MILGIGIGNRYIGFYQVLVEPQPQPQPIPAQKEGPVPRNDANINIYKFRTLPANKFLFVRTQLANKVVYAGTLKANNPVHKELPFTVHNCQ